ncbi:hypothetical protein Q669_29495 [Labrenzia sp. C1B10]|nr:hypothetical protein Q669_29495 [Labrenzia sp. C1B10]ERS05771.1 hypothetical protein Q675_29060 [Labrenzia sp. C1B70]
MRSFELAGSAFVQIGAQALSPYISTPPHLAWMRDGEFFAAQYPGTGSNTWRLRAYYPDSTPSDTEVSITNAITNIINFKPVFFKNQPPLTFTPVGTGAFKYHELSEVGSFTGHAGSATVDTSISNAGTVNCMAVSPDLTLMFRGVDAVNTSRVNVRNGNDANGDPSYGTSYAITHSAPIKLCAWTPDSRFVLLGTDAADTLVFRRTGDNMAQVSTISEVGLVPRRIVAAFDNRTIAISYTGGATTYLTKVYRRTGNTYDEVQEIANLGNLLDFSADGKMLVDAASRLAYQIDAGGVWQDVSATVMANIPTGVTSQAVSPHFLAPKGTTYLYDVGLLYLVNNGVDLGAVKYMLLDNTASFDSTDATVNDVTNAGAAEVFGSGWPQGGLAIQNIMLVSKENGAAALTCDPFAQVIVGGDLSVRYGLIYSGTTPIIFVDFQTEQTFLQNTEVSFETGSNGFVLYSV